METRLPNAAFMLMTPRLLSTMIYLQHPYLISSISSVNPPAWSKTEGLWLGAWGCKLGIDEPFVISWPRQYVTALGIAFPYNVLVGNKINFGERPAKLIKVLNIWSSRHLTILGRIAIV